MDDDNVSVRVAVRIRPQIPREVIDMCRVCTDVTPGEPQIILGRDKSFTYDYVFDMHENQETIYDTCVSSLIEGTLSGYNATVLAYGQTGSGKTYTMGTGFEVDISPDQIGIIPRAIKHLFDGIDKNINEAQEKGIISPEFKIMAQFMELYNEEVIDLFNPIGDNYVKEKGYKIHEDPAGGIHIKGVTMRAVSSPEEALQCLRLGALSRTTASTQMNTQSSRSHAIFTLHIKQQRLAPVDNDMMDSRDENNSEPANEFETLSAKFHFVDLAGSERLKRTGATGERAKEGISINCGLLALGNVISALGDVTKRALHVPYRDSKLTRLLQDSLGGNSQTVMIACISPSDRDFMETLNTLKYANRARNIKNKVVVNQDKSSRTITILKQQIAQLQLELVEYKQGKRIIGNDGTEKVNDMFYENSMLQSEVHNLRTRIKAMQDTINSLNAKNTALLAAKATENWSESGDPNTNVKDMVQAYLEEIENLRAKLMESEYTCAQLRKAAATVQDNMNRSIIMSNSFIDSFNDTPSLIEKAKKELQKKKKEVLFKRTKSEEGEEINENSESEKESDSESESDSEKVDDELQEELFNLTTDIDMKQKLIRELELSQQRLHTMRQHYEEKLLQLQARIKDTQEERDKVLLSFSGQKSEPTERVRKIKDEYERKLQEMQKELKRLQTAKKEHARLLKNQTQHESQLKSLKNELSDMKRAKVKLINKMKEESQKHKEVELKRNREIAQLRKESRRNANMIRTMEAEKRVKEQVLRRKQEEVLALRKETKRGLSRKAAGLIGPEQKFSPKLAKQKWINIEKVINKVALRKQGLVEQELRMEQLLEKRESLGKELEKYVQKRNNFLANGQDVTEINSFIDDIKSNINYIQETISETQHNVMEIEGEQEGDASDFVQSVFDLNEARYLMQKLFNMTLNQSYAVAQRDIKLKENEATLNEVKQEIYLRSQLLDHVLQADSRIYNKNNMITSYSSNNISDSEPSSNNSSRSSSPVDNNIQGIEQVYQNNKNKIRQKTVQPSDMLFGTSNDSDNQMTHSLDPSNFQTSGNPIVRVPSAPGSLKGLIPLPLRISTTLDSPTQKERKTPTVQSPRPSHRIPLSIQATKHGSMEQGLDCNAASSSGSPLTYRKMASREDNVFSRLTSSTIQVEPQSISGNIIPYSGKNHAKGTIQCVAIAEGHNNGVLALCATNELLFTGSMDRTVKVWDLQSRTELHTLHGHPNNVVAVRYNSQTNILLTASSYMLKVWDLRASNYNCIKILCSSGMSQSSSSISAAISNRSAQMPVGESQINDIVFSSNGSLICVAASDKVRVWDARKFTCVGKLSGGHQAAVMCLAVENYDNTNDIVITGSKDHYIKVNNLNLSATGNFGPNYSLEPPHYDGIQSLVIGKSILFSGSRDMCIKKWDLQEKELIQSLNNAHKGWICGLALMKNNRYLLSGCRTGNMKLWDAQTCDQLGDIRAHNSGINAIATSSNNIFTASNCGEVKIWKMTDC